jgi:hypothetical protein
MGQYRWDFGLSGWAGDVELEEIISRLQLHELV